MAAVDSYAEKSELEALLLVTFSETTSPTSTEIAAFLVQWSASLDGLMGKTEQHYGDSDSCPEWCKQAVLHVAAMKIEKTWANEFISSKELLDYMKKFIKSRDRDYNMPLITHKTPQIGIGGSGEDYEEK